MYEKQLVEKDYWGSAPLPYEMASVHRRKVA